MATYNTIRLMDYSNKFKEFELGAAAYAGMLMERTSTVGQIQPHSSAAATDPVKMFLFEKELEGKGPDEELASGERVQAWYPERGDEVYAILADGESVSYGDPLVSNGDGKLQAGTTAGAVVAYALEDMDLSGSSGAESEGPLGDYSKRLMVEAA